MRAIIVHGGCEDRTIPDREKQRRLNGVRKASQAGWQVLLETNSALDAVEAAIRCLEDDPAFDAGTGSYYNLFGEIEMDALLMDSSGRAGGVACIQNVQYPISVARKVMEETPHVLIVGEGATLFARTYGFPEYHPASEESKAFLEEQISKLPESLRKILERYKEIRAKQRSFSTVGAVALDDTGLVVAGTSTGGIPQKLPGRVGDSALIGAGTFASRGGGASATGMGEGIIRLAVTRSVLDRVERGIEIKSACEELVKAAGQIGIPCGVAAMDKDGKAAAAHNGYYMPVIYYSDKCLDGIRLE